MTKLILSLFLVLFLTGQARAAEPIVKYKSINGEQYNTLLEAQYNDELQPIIESLRDYFSPRYKIGRWVIFGQERDAISFEEAAQYILATQGNCYFCHSKEAK